MRTRVVEKIRIGEGPFMNAQDHGIESVEYPYEGNGNVTRIHLSDGRIIETTKPVEVWKTAYMEVQAC